MRRPPPILAAFLFLLALLVPVAPAPAQTPLNYTACPPSFPIPGDPRREDFNRLLTAARSRKVDVVVLGSSIYTISGQGGYMVSALTAELAEMTGNIPATGWMPVGNFGTTPPSQYGIRGATSAGASAPTGYADTYALPNFAVYKFTTWSGNSVQLEPDAWSSAIGEYGMPGSFYRTGSTQSYRPEWICTSYGGVSSEASSATTFGWYCLKRTTAAAYGPWGALFSAAGETLGRTTLNQVTAVNIPSTDLNGRACTPNSATFDAWRLGCPATNGAAPITYAHDASAPYYNFVLEHGSGSGQFFACAQRWVNTTTTAGFAVTSASQSGAKINQIQTDHNNSGPVLRAMKPEIVCIALHTNSAGNNIKAFDAGTPSNSYYHLGLTLIDWVRTYVPNCWIVLIPDGPRTDLTAPQLTEYGLMVGSNQLLADARPRVLALNLTLSLEREGYTNANQTFTGYTYKGAWTTATAYAVGDIVGLDAGGEVLYYRCIQAHTSASTDKPSLSTNAPDYWRAHRRFLTPNATVASAPTDNVHPGTRGAMITARHIVKLMYEGMQQPVRQPRGRKSRRRPGHRVPKFRSSGVPKFRSGRSSGVPEFRSSAV